MNKKKNNRFPEWLNLALGVGAGNIYGGFRNEWTNEEGGQFVLNDDDWMSSVNQLVQGDN